MTTKKTPRPRRVSTFMFVLFVLGIVGAGLGAVMVTTTAIGAQSRELAKLQTEATALEYESASLRSQLETLDSTASLALRATQLGLVPNPYPAFVLLGTGEVVGEPTTVRGDEFPQLRGQAPAPQPSPSVVTGADPSSTPPPVQPEAASPSEPEDIVAAGEPTGAPSPDDSQPATAGDGEGA